MANFFPDTEQDSTAKSILDRLYKVTERTKHSNFVPYEDDYSGHVSPFTDFMYYQKLPEVYRTFDKPLGRPLYRYLQSLLEGGYANLVYNAVRGERGIENLLDLINPETCPSEFLPIYCKSMGIEWFQDLVIQRTEGSDPYYYIRTFLCNVGEIYKRRGTESVVKYIAKVLTSMDVKLRYSRVFSDNSLTRARILWVELQAHTEEEIQNVGLNSEVIKRFIDTQIPYYITTSVLYILREDIELNDSYIGFVCAKTVRQSIVVGEATRTRIIADSEEALISDSDDSLISDGKE